MASIHRKSKIGVWYISYRQGGILKHRSLGTKSGAEARRLKKGIELKAESDPNIELVVVERPKSEVKNPPLNAFWQEFLGWAKQHHSQSAIDKYGVWFRQFREFANIDRRGDATVQHVQEFKSRIREPKKSHHDDAIPQVPFSLRMPSALTSVPPEGTLNSGTTRAEDKEWFVFSIVILTSSCNFISKSRNLRSLLGAVATMRRLSRITGSSPGFR